VLEAFDTLFNRRDHTAAERSWSPRRIQHGARVAPGCEGLFNLIGLKRRALNDPTLTEDPTVRSIYFEPYVTNQHHRTPIPGTQTGQKKF
jgi:hypothetical protein